MTVRAVHHLNCATMCPLGGFLLGAGGLRGRWVGHCLIVETERDGLVLVDTGFGTRDVEGKTAIPRRAKLAGGLALDPAEPALAQLETLGYTAGDVRHVVVTHLHYDHAGGLSDFPHARVHVHAREHAAAMARSAWQEREGYLPPHWAHGPKWELYREDGDTWRGLPAVTRLRGLDADIGLLPMHGHSRGHSAVIVSHGERWLLHAGDAYFHRSAMTSDDEPIGYTIFQRANLVDAAARRASVAALRQLRESYRDLDVFCAHDEREYSALRGRA